MLPRQCIERARLLIVFSTSRTDVLRGSGGHGRMCCLEARFAWCCNLKVVLLNTRGEVSITVVGLLPLKLAPVV